MRVSQRDHVWLNELFSLFKFFVNNFFYNCRSATGASRLLRAWPWNLPFSSVRNRVSESRGNSIMCAFLFFLNKSRFQATLILFHEKRSQIFFFNTSNCYVFFLMIVSEVFRFFDLKSFKLVCENQLVCDRWGRNLTINWVFGPFSNLRVRLAIIVILFFWDDLFILFPVFLLSTILNLDERFLTFFS
jgi:hypothetical protein